MISGATVGRRKGFSENTRNEILVQGAKCHYCSSPYPSEVDHVMPFSRGGSDDRENLVPACHRCNMDKSDLTMDEWQAARDARGAEFPPLGPTELALEVILALPVGALLRITDVNEAGRRIVEYVSEVHKFGWTPEAAAHATNDLFRAGVKSKHVVAQ